MRSVLILDGEDYKKHSSAIGSFRKNYVKTGIFPEEYSDIIGDASSPRGKSDYDDFFITSRQEAAEQVQSAMAFCETIREYLAQRLDQQDVRSEDNPANGQQG